MRRPGTQKVYEAFSEAAAPELQIRPSRRKKRPAPFSLRLTYEERARLDSAAGSIPLGTYIKGRLFDDLPAVPRQRTTARADKAILTELLGVLGKSKLPTSLRDMAKAATNGTLPLTPDLEADLKRACSDIADMRLRLLKALGLRP